MLTTKVPFQHCNSPLWYQYTDAPVSLLLFSPHLMQCTHHTLTTEQCQLAATPGAWQLLSQYLNRARLTAYPVSGSLTSAEKYWSAKHILITIASVEFLDGDVVASEAERGYHDP